MEDDRGLARLLQKRLETQGYRVDVAGNGRDGIAMLDAGHYDVIIADYNMPLCGGLDVIRILSTRGPLPPLIMVTGAGNEKIAVEAMKAGAADYIVKDVEMGYLELLPIVIEKVLHGVHLELERKKMEEELLRAGKLESIGVLAGGIAHDFNNLLAAILGTVSFAKMLVKADEKVSKLLDDAEKASVRAGELTSQLITFAKGGAPLKRRARIGDLIRNTTRFTLSGSNVRSEFSIPDDMPLVEADEAQIRQVLHNIVMNAREAMPEGGIVTVSARSVSVGRKNALPLPDGEYLEIAIHDEGVGIAPQHLSKIFDPYFTTKEMGSRKGMGLGLAVSYSIIKNHDGLITVEAQQGVGSTFHIYLPVTPAGREEEKKRPVAAVAGTGRVLIMDDEESIREMASEMLRHLGYETAVARDGEEAVQLYARARAEGRSFQTVILDLTIPGGMGGKDALQRLKEIDPQVRAIVSSGYADDLILSEFRKEGFQGVIAKPYRMAELGAVVSDVLRKAG